MQELLNNFIKNSHAGNNNHFNDNIGNKIDNKIDGKIDNKIDDKIDKKVDEKTTSNDDNQVSDSKVNNKNGDEIEIIE